MPAPLLQTKLYLPRPRAGVVPRARLHGRLDGAAGAKVVLVCAPAGFGKTTLLAQWLAEQEAPPLGRRAAWLSLDRGDDDPVTFWTYVVTALRSVAPEAGADALALLGDGGPVQIRLVLTTLLNDLAVPGGEVVLVLDDYHLVEAREVHEEMAFLLEHLPPRVRLVLAGRADPPLPLARLRARGELVEVRAADLRFTPDEATAYLVGVMGLPVTARDVAALDDRTEGWIAALQLAALSMQGREDVSGFVAGFTGDDRYVVDYLVEEVLQRQPPAVRDFLLQTSVLARLTGPLCDAVTGQQGGRAALEALDRGNLFVVPLDDHRRAYRYHHLFGDVLRARLAEESPDLVRTLHRRASDWYAGNGDPAEGIRHATAAQDFDRAADLVELAMTDARRTRQEAALRHWIEQLPAGLVRARPVLANGLAGALLSTGEVEGVERHLRDAEQALADDPRARDEQELRRVPAGIAVHRAGLALALGDPAATVAHARRALELLEADHHIARGAATALVGLASWVTGDLDAAVTAYSGCLVSLERAGHASDVLGCSLSLADIQVTQGRLREARRTYEQALRLRPPDGAPPLRGTADMLVGLAALHLEHDDLAEAERLLTQAEALGEHNGLPQNAYRSRVVRARLLQVQGDPAGALALLGEAQRRYVGDMSPDVRPVAAVRARALLAQGRLAEVLDWVRGRDLSVDDAPDHLREYEHVTLARALLARHGADGDGDALAAATTLLDRLAAAAEAGGRTGSLVEVLVLRALAARAGSDLRGALEPLGRALALAGPEGYVRLFLDEGPPLAALLRSAAGRGPASGYAARLLAAGGTDAPRPPARQGLVEPLSDRERDVLRLLATELSGPEIAGELVVSLNTVRTHTKSIYAKLGVNSRRAAVRRAQELDLLSPGAPRHNHHMW
ncbi:LuxR C-terminal-related transcriptional regulator [Kineosporia sp. A_224]|uniref:LuxR C-terminal-related transcriptional regulator n=1 Tax=Kineosporia sp. A_224 TaxID=1962180 RepID=UPI000B4B1E1E|nr:LuxR C-terminal-related transcriptional regulator [Kineosporia sp. A_224]